MTIKFADPGFDWTTYIVVGAVAVGLLLVAGLCLLAYRFRSSTYSVLDEVSFYFFLAAGVWTAVSVIISPPFSVGAYQSRVEVALYQALEDAGFDQIEMEWDDAQEGRKTLTGTLHGEPFSGTITDLNYPRDFAYKIEESK